MRLKPSGPSPSQEVRRVRIGAYGRFESSYILIMSPTSGTAVHHWHGPGARKRKP
jgi:hypothetical protein